MADIDSMLATAASQFKPPPAPPNPQGGSAPSAPPPSPDWKLWSDNSQAQPDQSHSFLSDLWNEGVVNPAKQVRSGYYASAAEGAHALSNAAKLAGKVIGKPVGGGFESAENYYNQEAAKDAGGRTDLMSSIYRGIGAAPGTIAKYVLGSEVAGPTAAMAGIDALTAADKGPKQAAIAGVKGALTGGALRVMAPASLPARAVGGATAMGAPVALAGGNASDVASAAITGAAMGAGAGNAAERQAFQQSKSTPPYSAAGVKFGNPTEETTAIDPKGAPSKALVQGLRPRSSQLNFEQSADLALPHIKAAEAEVGPIKDVDGLIEGTNAAQRNIWKQYEAQGGSDIKADLTPVANAILASVPKKTAFENPAAVQAAQDLAGRYYGKIVPLRDVEDLLQGANAELANYEAKYPGVKTQLLKSSPETAGTVATADALRDVLYGAIDTGGGSGEAARELKRTYGSLSDIKQTAMRRKIILERQAPQNLAQQLANIDMVKNAAIGAGKILAGHPIAGGGQILGGVLEPKSADWLREQNSTNGIIKNVFENYSGKPRPLPGDWRENVVNPDVVLGPATVPQSGTAATAAQSISESETPKSAAESAEVLAREFPPSANPAAESAQALQFAPTPPSQYLPSEPTGKSAAESAQSLMQIPQVKQAIESADLLKNLPATGLRELPAPSPIPPVTTQQGTGIVVSPEAQEPATPSKAPFAQQLGSQHGDIVNPPKNISRAHILGRSIVREPLPDSAFGAESVSNPPRPKGDKSGPIKGGGPKPGMGLAMTPEEYKAATTGQLALSQQTQNRGILNPDGQEAPTDASAGPVVPSAAPISATEPVAVITPEPAAAQAEEQGAVAASENQPSVQAPTPSQTEVIVPGEGRSFPAQYRLRELAEVQPSHNGVTFQPNPKYPYTNDRTYTNAEDRAKVLQATPGLFKPALHVTDNPDASNGPPVVDSDGYVLGGNGRSMQLARAYSVDPQGAIGYRQLLSKKAPQFGIDPAEVARMNQPVLVREIANDDVHNVANAITDFNKTGTASLRPAERMIADSRRVSPQGLYRLKNAPPMPLRMR